MSNLNPLGSSGAASSNPPKFRRTGSNDGQANSNTFTLPSLTSNPSASGFVSLRRSTRSTTTTPIKSEPTDPTLPLSASPYTPRKRVKIEHDASPSSPRTPRSRLKAESTDSETLVSLSEDIKPSPNTKSTPKKPSTPKKTMPLPPLLKAHPTPARWEEQYALIERMRRGLIAPVDTMGCERPDLGPVPLAPVVPSMDAFCLPSTPNSSTNHAEPPLPSPSIERTLPAIVRRFHVLVSLMLSSQTKDTVTSAAVTSLHLTLPGGLTPESLAGAERSVVEGCINKVGFWRRKAEYIQEAASRLLMDNLDLDVVEEGVKTENGDLGIVERGDWQKGDIPKTIEGLCKLKGVGPKMAYLALQCAWDINAGIGVDVHVHRITNRLKWHKPPTITPEQTRVNLESWLPSHLHKGINPMLVGFGQRVCLPIGPRCDICLLGIKRICPSRVASVKAEGRKPVEYTYTLDVGDEGDMEDMVLMPKEEALAEFEGVKEEVIEGMVKEEL